MSVQNRLADAQVLYEADRLHGALSLLLIAVGATSRKRYPHGTMSRKEPTRRMGDAEAFTTFLQDEFQNLTSSISNVGFGTLRIEYRGTEQSLPELFYKILRCELIHEATMPIDVEFIRDPLLLVAGGDVTVFNEKILQGLANILHRCPENHTNTPVPALTKVGNKRGLINACLIPHPIDLRRPICYSPDDSANILGRK